MNGNISLVAKLKQEAKAARDFEDFQTAASVLDKAIEILLGEWNHLRSEVGPEMGAYRSVVEKELADCYGIKGGLYRRAAMEASGAEKDALLADAERMYKEGSRFERDDSYNLTNTIVIPLIRNPACLHELQPKAVEARDEVGRQLQGVRATQWWAWADLGLLNLLVGDYDGALQAYAQFGRAGAQSKDFKSTISVLEDLRRALPVGEIHDRLTGAIAFLELQQRKVS
jgi:hypothetical protein